jgi:hypothetical protein
MKKKSIGMRIAVIAMVVVLFVGIIIMPVVSLL